MKEEAFNKKPTNEQKEVFKKFFSGIVDDETASFIFLASSQGHASIVSTGNPSEIVQAMLHVLDNTQPQQQEYILQNLIKTKEVIDAILFMRKRSKN